MNYYSIKYYNLLSENVSNILHNNNDNVKIIYKTYNNSIETINLKVKKL